MNFAFLALIFALGLAAVRFGDSSRSRAGAIAVCALALTAGVVWCASTVVGHRLLLLFLETNARFSLFLQALTGVLLVVVPARALVESRRGDAAFRRHVRHVGGACIMLAILLVAHAVLYGTTFRAMGLTPLVEGVTRGG